MARSSSGSVLLLQRWLFLVACLRLLSGESGRGVESFWQDAMGSSSKCSTLQQVIGVHLLSAPLLLPPITQPQCRPAVYIGIFDPEKFRVALIDLQPQLGERKRNAEAAAAKRAQRPDAALTRHARALHGVFPALSPFSPPLHAPLPLRDP